MTLKTVTVTLPETLYRRAKETAEATDRSLQEVLEQSIALSLPPLEDDLPAHVRAILSALTLLSDEALWQVARSEWEEEKQLRLEELVEMRKGRSLTPDEGLEFDALFADSELSMLKKAESYRLLTRRGYTIPWINH